MSDKLGRKWIMIAGMLMGVFLYRPIFGTILRDANIDRETKNLHNENSHALMINSEILKSDTLKEKDIIITSTKSNWQLANGTKVMENRIDTLYNFSAAHKAILKADSKPLFNGKILPNAIKWKFIFLIWIMIIMVTMAYGPIAAFLVELFPTKIRYSSMSLPYHIGNGVFGGLVPFIATLLSVSFTKDPLIGLWYPIGIAITSATIGILFLSNKIDKNVND